MNDGEDLDSAASIVVQGIRAKQPVKLSNGRVVHMRVKEEELSEVEDGVEHGEDEGARHGTNSCEQPVVGVGSSSANDLHSNEGEFAPPASNQSFVSDDEAHALRNCATLQVMLFSVSFCAR